MRIGLLIYGSLATISGGFLYDRQLVKELESAGHTVEIVSIPWRTYPRHLIDNWSSKLGQRLRQANVDLLLQDELNHPSLAWLNGRIKAEVAYPLISIVHHLRSSEYHPPVLMPFYRWVERRYLNSVDGYLCNSRTTQATVMALAPHAKPQMIAYPAADHHRPPSGTAVGELIRHRGSRTQPLRILFVGNVIARKGLHHLLHALARIPHEQWRLQVIGNLTADASYTAGIRRLVAGLHLDANVTFTGTVSDETIVAAYCASDLFVAPAYEGFGIGYLEAMSFGLPVIASTAGAAHEFVSDGVNGYLVVPADHATLTQRIEGLIGNRKLLTKLGIEARQRYDRHPTWRASFAPVLEWLEAQRKP